MGRDVWLKNINSYFVKCKYVGIVTNCYCATIAYCYITRPVLTNEVIETLMVGMPKTTKGLLRMCNFKKSYSGVAKDFLAQILDVHVYPGTNIFTIVMQSLLMSPFNRCWQNSRFSS